MKRMISIILLLCFASSICYAEELKELTYRNIPWGTSVDEIKDPASVYSYESRLPWEESLLILPTWRSLQETDYNAGYEGSVIGSANYKVGGYALSRINVYCMYGVKEGKLLKEPSDSELYAVDYLFDVIDTKAAYENLLLKMTELYGLGQTTEEKAESSVFLSEGEKCIIPQTLSNTVWNGANDTHILLYGAWINNEDELPDSISSDFLRNCRFVFITYYKGGINERLKEICKLEEQLEREEEIHNNEGYEGL